MLPVTAVLPQLLETLEARCSAVLVAPPGAGKTTGVPPALLGAPWRGDGRIVVVEPRRLAARAAASRMSETMGEPVGRTVGYRVRNDTRVSAATRIELVTAGVFLRMIVADAALDGVAAILFDEVHERAVDMDLGLALAIDAQSGLRADLRLVAMSATLDGRRFADLLGGPIVESEGRLFPVETRHLGRDPALRIEDAVAGAVLRGAAEETGSILAFLPGQGEIARTAERLDGRLPGDVLLTPLFGAMEGRAQDAAIRPAPPGWRKVVLATAIAETSLTIEGVRLVIDGGLARRPRYDPGSGLSRLETVRVSRAAADQRRGRAGRTGPGVCYRLWDAPQTAALAAFDRPEILEADLSPLALTLLAWGIADPGKLKWLDPPPAAAFAAALDLLERLGACKAGRLTPYGERLAGLPLPPRLAHLVLAGAAAGEGRPAAAIAAILAEPGLGGRDTDLRTRLEAFRRDRSERARAAGKAADRWAALAGAGGQAAAGEQAGWGGSDPAALLALAFPERLAQARGGRGRFRMAHGGGARLDEADPLAAEPFLAIAEVQGGGPDARILLAAPIDLVRIETLFAERIVAATATAYDEAADLASGVRRTCLDRLVLRSVPVTPDPHEIAAALAAAALARGLDAPPWPDDVSSLRARIAFLRRRDPGWPDLSDRALQAGGTDWLAPALVGKRRLADVAPAELRAAFAGLLPWSRSAQLDRLAPGTFTAPSGRVMPIDYSADDPVVRIAAQNLFGLAVHPAVLAGTVPLVFEILSPAGRPIQVTRDLPAFWKGSWRDVRADMRGRYPKHSWPEDPASAAPVAGVGRRR